jgi:L-arabinokinase
MYRIIDGSTHNFDDVATFIEILNTLERHPAAAARTLFNQQAEIFVTRAPGRLDVMGGIADYSGSLVLQLPLREAILAALQCDESRELKIVSLCGENNKSTNVFNMSLDDFERDGEPISYAEARAIFRRDTNQSWAAYVAGAFLVLMRERQIRFKCGARILIASNVPEGKGVSSSAAIEVAVFNSVLASFDISIEPREIALLCQKVENEVVGAPCGVMDQMAVECGEADKLLALLCQPAELQGMRSIPEEISVWGIDSGIRHSVGAGDYGSVRTGAFMGYRIIAELAGFSVEETSNKDVIRIEDSKWHGYMANLTPAEFEQNYAISLPEQITGKDFLARYGGITDTATTVQPEKNYAVLNPTAHPVYENARVNRFAQLLSAAVTESVLKELGELMYGSHASYSACGLGSKGTDLLVELVREEGDTHGLYGAKITGGGSGGTVAVLGRRGADQAIERVASRYARQTGYHPRLFAGSSPGAAAFGCLKLIDDK